MMNYDELNLLYPSKFLSKQDFLDGWVNIKTPINKEIKMKLTESEMLNLFKLIMNKLDNKRNTIDTELLKLSATKIASELLDK